MKLCSRHGSETSLTLYRDRRKKFHGWWGWHLSVLLWSMPTSPKCFSLGKVIMWLSWSVLSAEWLNNWKRIWGSMLKEAQKFEGNVKVVCPWDFFVCTDGNDCNSFMICPLYSWKSPWYPHKTFIGSQSQSVCPSWREKNVMFLLWSRHVPSSLQSGTLLSC
jgi:hypothetical protein